MIVIVDGILQLIIYVQPLFVGQSLSCFSIYLVKICVSIHAAFYMCVID